MFWWSHHALDAQRAKIANMLARPVVDVDAIATTAATPVHELFAEVCLLPRQQSHLNPKPYNAGAPQNGGPAC